MLMITSNPFSELSELIRSGGMQAYVIVMFLLVAAGTIVDVIHKRSAKYFFENTKKAKERAVQPISGATKASVAMKTLARDILASAEFDNQKRRLAHLLTMYGFILFLVTTVIMVFSNPTPEAPTPALWPVLWHLGALMVCIGGYWFWFTIRVDVAAEGHPWYRVVQADLFILSLLATTTFGLIWSWFQHSRPGGLATFFFGLFIIASTTLFGTVLWSKFAHMFVKPAAAFQKRFAEADGSRDNLPAPADKPKQFGLGIKRERPRHY